MTRAHWILIHPGTVSCVLHGSQLSRPLVFVLFVSCLTPCKRCAVLVTPSSWPRPRIPSLYPCPYPTGPPASHVYTPLGRMLPCGACPRVRFLRHAMVAPIRSPASCSLRAVCLLVVCSCFLWEVFLLCAPRGPPTPAFPLCIRCLSSGPLLLLFFLPSSLHARTSPLHWSSGYGSPLFSSLVFPTLRGVPLPVPARARWAPLPRVTVSPLHSPPYPRPLSLVRLPYCCSPAQCAPRCSSRRQGCILRAVRLLSACARSLTCKPIWAASPGTPSGESPVVRPRRPPLHQFPIFGMASFCGP